MTSFPDPLVIPASSDTAIACDMTDATDTPSERLAEYRRLFAHALVAHERSDGDVVFTFESKPGVREWLTDLVQREAECCPFLSYEVRASDDRLVWTIGGDARTAIQALLGEIARAPDQA